MVTRGYKIMLSYYYGLAIDKWERPTNLLDSLSFTPLSAYLYHTARQSSRLLTRCQVTGVSTDEEGDDIKYTLTT
ncbi:hypothetical protein YC2023_005161 [Brassica napus]